MLLGFGQQVWDALRGKELCSQSWGHCSREDNEMDTTNKKHSKCPNPNLYKECTVARNKSFLLHHSTSCAKAKSQLGSSVWSIGSGFPPIAEIQRETSCQKKRCGNEIKGQHIPLDIPRNRQQWPTSSRHMHCSQHTTCHVRASMDPK